MSYKPICSNTVPTGKFTKSSVFFTKTKTPDFYCVAANNGFQGFNANTCIHSDSDNVESSSTTCTETGICTGTGTFKLVRSVCGSLIENIMLQGYIPNAHRVSSSSSLSSLFSQSNFQGLATCCLLCANFSRC